MIRKPFFPGVRLLCLLFIALASLLMPIQPAAAQCAPPLCEEPTYEPPPSGGGGGEGGAWSGYSDGRLNPDMAEYYSIWCANDRIEVWGGIPSPQLLNTIAIVDVLALDNIGSFDAGSGQTVARTGDIVTILGSGGNGGGSGSKSFSLSECIARNGGTPELPPPNNPPPVQNTESPADTEDARNNVWLCLPGAESAADFIRCLDFFAPDNAGADYFYGIFWAIVTFCAGGFAPAVVVALPAFRVWRRRRKT